MDKLDLLAIMAHPDDAELGCGGTLAAAALKGQKTGILDLTVGEMGTRGTPEARTAEAANAGVILGLSFRGNLGLSDGFINPADKESILRLIPYIRALRPEIILANSIEDRHPDHGRAARLTAEAAFLSGLVKVETEWEGESQAPWRPKGVYNILQTYYNQVDLIVDVSKGWETKLASIKAYKSQFYDPESTEPVTFISDDKFLDFVEGRSRDFGKRIGAEHGEGFTTSHPIGVKNLLKLQTVF